MKKFILYKHKNCRDVAMMPIRVVQTPDYLVLKIQWFNVVNEPTTMNLSETVRIKHEDIPNWIKL